MMTKTSIKIYCWFLVVLRKVQIKYQ